MRSCTFLSTLFFFLELDSAHCQEKLQTLSEEGMVQGLAISGNGNAFAIAVAPQDSIVVYQRDDGKSFRLPREHGHTRALAFSPDGKTLAFGLMADDAKKIPYMTVRVVLLGKPTSQYDLLTPAAEINQMRFASTGHFLAASQDGGMLSVWDLRTKSLQLQSDTHASSPAIAFSPNGSNLTSASGDHLLRWDILARKKIQEATTRDRVMTSCFTSSGKNVLVGIFPGNTVEEWAGDAKKPERVIKIGDFQFPCDQMVLSPDAKKVAVLQNHDVLIFELPSARFVTKLTHSKGFEFARLAFSGDGAFLLSGATTSGAKSQSEIILWRLEAAQKQKK